MRLEASSFHSQAEACSARPQTLSFQALVSCGFLGLLYNTLDCSFWKLFAPACHAGLPSPHYHRGSCGDVGDGTTCQGDFCRQSFLLFYPSTFLPEERTPLWSPQLCYLWALPGGPILGLGLREMGLELCYSQSWLTADIQFLSIINMSPSPNL